ncbi:TIGR03364 family FAD-dependent oxidoreductase [Xylanimonas oleitrophica]|uniref:TIGR03364 family FAD-dependent oxidoreductase n=1 Tax=Xylanimonas oleitrophica TaxID=2607479 RepID=UPI0015D0084E|nr:TIGR03364 family FAD-dependent oxidoreductase [Xylanimonas oleitrophica]
MPRRAALAPPRPARPAALPQQVDVVVVGAGIVGLAHAVEARARGASVVVVERHAHATGASVRALGHVAVTGQDGPTLAPALASRDRWLALSRQAGFVAHESGALAVARVEDELAVLEDLAAARDGAVTLLDRAGVAARLPRATDGVVGGAVLSMDLQVDPREAVPALTAWLARQPGASVVHATAVVSMEPGSGRTLVRTTRGDVVARRVVVAVGHDVDGLLPEVGEAHGLRRVTSQVLRATLRSTGEALPVVAGTALLRQPWVARSPHHRRILVRLEDERPRTVRAGVALVVTQHAEGRVDVGSTRLEAPAADPFRQEALDDLLLTESALVLGEVPQVVERWSAVQATAPEPFVVARPQRGVLAVVASGGDGMTTALGLAQRTVEGFF